jgi:ribosomal protein S8
MWLQEEGFMDRVRLWWASYTFQGSPSFVLAQKLKALKVNLKLWNEQVFENVDSIKKSSSRRFAHADRLEEERGLDSKELLKKSLIVSDQERIIL